MEAARAVRPRKRSLSIAGRRTSASIETPIWLAIKQIAEERSVSLQAVFTEIDRSRGATTLSAAIRIFALAHAYETYRSALTAAMNGM